VAASLLHGRVKDHEVVHYLKESGLGTHLAQRAVIGLRSTGYPSRSRLISNEPSQSSSNCSGIRTTGWSPIAPSGLVG
jgi:hypothetical protein